MAVVMYLGLPGDGKSVSGVRRLIDELGSSSRTIVTNLPLEIGELETYSRQEFGRDCDVRRRVVLLDESQVRKFWLIRGQGWRLIDLPDGQYKQNQFPDLSKTYRWLPGDGHPEREDLAVMLAKGVPLPEDVETGTVEGCLYIIDECQNFWPARSFQSTPPGLLFYLSQHRHLGDDLVFITQKESQVEKVVRNLVSEFWVFRNLGRRRRFGFRLPGLFGWACYNEPPSAQGASYAGVGTFKLDIKGVASCYRTADGVGIGGPLGADVGARKRGLHWGWFIALTILGLALLAMLPGAGAKVLSWALLRKGSSEVAQASVGKVVPLGRSGGVAVVDRGVLVDQVPAAKAVPASNLNDKAEAVVVRGTNLVRLVGFAGDRWRWSAVLSDGRSVSDQDVERVVWSDRGIAALWIDGGRVSW